MKTITQYRQEIKDLTNKVGDLDAAATSASRDLTNEEIDLKNDILDKIEDVEKLVLALERQEKVLERLDSPQPGKRPPKTAPSTKWVWTTGPRISSLLSALRWLLLCRLDCPVVL